MAAQCDVISKLPRRVGSQPGGRRAGEGGWDRQDEVAVQEVARRELLEALLRLQLVMKSVLHVKTRSI